MKDYAIRSRPTIRVETFANVLREGGAAALAVYAPEYYEICVAWEVNPAVALAFFAHESQFGTKGIAVSTKNWGNLRMGAGALFHAQGFAWYASWSIGLNDFCKLLRGPLYEGAGLLTVSQVIPRYAPAADHNNEQAYIAAVNGLCAKWEGL